MTVYNLDVLFPNFELVHCPMPGSNCCFLTCIQVSRETGNMVWYSHLLKNVPQFIVIHKVKGFSIVNKAEVDAFLEFPCFFYDLMDVGNLSSGSSACLNTACSSESSQFTYYRSLAWRIYYLASMWNECNCTEIWTFFSIAFLWDWNENWHFRVLWPLLSFPNFLGCWVQHFTSIIF